MAQTIKLYKDGGSAVVGYKERGYYLARGWTLTEGAEPEVEISPEPEVCPYEGRSKRDLVEYAEGRGLQLDMRMSRERMIGKLKARN